MDGEEHSDDADDADELDDEHDDDLDADREETAESVTIEITGLSLYTHHGVSEAVIKTLRGAGVQRETARRSAFSRPAAG